MTMTWTESLIFKWPKQVAFAAVLNARNLLTEQVLLDIIEDFTLTCLFRVQYTMTAYVRSHDSIKYLGYFGISPA